MNKINDIQIVEKNYTQIFRTYLNNNKIQLPSQLALSFPHIIEKIVSLWHKPNEARSYFCELMLPQRQERIGFPPAVYSEIFALSNAYDNLCSTKKNPEDIWKGYE